MARAVGSAFLALPFALLLAGFAPLQARADVQLSARLGTGGGASLVRGASTDGFFEAHLVADMLFGPRLPDQVRVGPSLELRTNDFATAEVTLGGSLLLPVVPAFPIVLTAALGYASRRDADVAGTDPLGADGAFGLARVAFGYRPFNYLTVYAYGLQLYVDARRSVTGPERWEISGGIEVDLEFAFVIPVLFLVTWLGGGDPDE